MTQTTLTDASKALFVALAEDAKHWTGMPLLGGNVLIDKQTRGSLTQLKKAGLIKTAQGGDKTLVVHFTGLGREYAEQLNINILDY